MQEINNIGREKPQIKIPELPYNQGGIVHFYSGKNPGDEVSEYYSPIKKSIPSSINLVRYAPPAPKSMLISHHSPN